MFLVRSTTTSCSWSPVVLGVAVVLVIVVVAVALRTTQIPVPVPYSVRAPDSLSFSSSFLTPVFRSLLLMAAAA